MKTLRRRLSEIRSTLEVEFSTIQNSSRQFADSVKSHQDTICARLVRKIDDDYAPKRLDPSFIYFGTKPESITLPLQLLRIQTAELLLPLGLNLDFVQMVQDRIDLLLAESHDVSSKILRGSCKERPLLSPGSSGNTSTLPTRSQCNGCYQSAWRCYSFSRYENIMGTFTVRIIRDGSAKTPASSISTIQLFFLPKQGVSSIGIAALLVKIWPYACCQIPPHVCSWNVVPWNSEVFFKVKENDAHGLRELFHKQEASPFDMDSLGNSMLFLAILFESVDVFDLLISQGAAEHEIGAVPLSSFLLVGITYANRPADFLVLRQMIATAVAYGSNLDEAHGLLAVLERLFVSKAFPTQPSPIQAKLFEFLLHLETDSTSFVDDGCMIVRKESSASTFFQNNRGLSDVLPTLGIRLSFQQDVGHGGSTQEQFGLRYLKGTDNMRHTLGLPELLSFGLHTMYAINTETRKLRSYAEKSLLRLIVWKEFREAAGLRSDELTFTNGTPANKLWGDLDAKCGERPFRRFLRTTPVWSPESVLSNSHNLRETWHSGNGMQNIVF